jgi:hypothetical protein
VQSFFFLALGLPWLLLTTRVPEDAGARGFRSRIEPRVPALLGVAPGVALFLGWAALRLSEPAEIAPGQPWKAWGPLLSEQNLAIKPFQQNREELFQVLANLFHDGSDRWPLHAVGTVALAGLVLGLVFWSRDAQGPVERLRLLGLGLLALALYFLLPFDIRGYIYYLNTRYAHLAAALLITCVPITPLAFQRRLLWASAACALLLGLIMGRGFRAFSREASQLDALVEATAPQPKVMGLIFETRSHVVRFPVFLHSAAVLARARGGVTNFSFALTPHSPLRYQGPPPPTFPSEWRPDELDYATQGRFYDHFLVRGVHPSRLFGPLLQSELAVAAQAGDTWLVRRR